MEATPNNSIPQVYAHLRSFLEDETFDQYKRHLQALGPGSGRGRPCKLVPVSAFTNRLILQLGLLRLITNATWSEMSGFCLKLLTIDQCLYSLVSTVEKRAAKLNADDRDTILQFLAEERDMVYPKSSPYCIKFGVTKAFLFGEQDAMIPQSHSNLPNGLIIELERFKHKKRLTASNVFAWVSILCPHSITSIQMNKKITDLMKKHNRKGKSRSRKPAEYDTFLETSFSLQSRPTS